MSVVNITTGQSYDTLTKAISDSSANDVIQISAGTYSENFPNITHNLTIESVGGTAYLTNPQPDPPNGRAILNVPGNLDVSLTVSGLDISGAVDDASNPASVGGANGAGILFETGNGALVVENCRIHGNEDGILTGFADAFSVNGMTVTITNCEIDNNGVAPSNPRFGYDHDLYIGGVTQFSITDSFVHDALGGHEIKSRALASTIENNVIADGNAPASYEIDLPNGGTDIVTGNFIEKGPNSPQGHVVDFGGEGAYSGSSLIFSNNTIVADTSRSVIGLLNATTVPATIANDTFYGTTAVSQDLNGQTGDIVTGATFLPLSAAPSYLSETPLGGVYREASALITAPLAFVARAGGTEALSIGIANTAAADGYSEQLLANVTGASGALTVAPSTTGDINAGGSASLGVAVNTGTAGTLAAHVTLDLISDGTTIDNLGTVDLGTQTVAVTGKIYREAAASAGTLAIVAHAGQTAAASLLLGNTAAADGYSEDLIGTVIATSAGIAATSATTGDILAGNAGTIGLSFLSATAGTFTGGVTLQLASDGTPIDGLGTVDLGSRTVAVTASVYNYATAAVSQIGSAGTLSGSGNSYTLDLGTVTQAAARTQAVLKLQNIAAGLADSLTGSSAFSGTTSAFINSGFGSFGTIAAGAASGALDISLSTANTGTFSETASFNLASTDSGGSSVLAPVKITVTGTVVAPAGQVFTLTSGADTVAGGAVANTVIATNGALSAGDRIDAGSSGANALVLSGGGTFNLALPATLAGIQTINAQEGQPTNTANGIVYPSTQQTVYLRAGMNGVTVHVAPPAATGNTAPPTITIIGAANNDFIDLHDSTGADAVTMGAGESFLGGSGNDTILVTAATLGDTINGGTGAAELYFSGGGTVTLGGTVSNIATLFLAKAAGSYSVTANSIAGLVVQDANTLYADTLAAGGAGQTLTGGGAGRMTFIGGAQTTFKDSAALLKGDTIRNLLAGDQIDITGLGFVAGASSLGFGASGGNTTLQVYLGSALQTSFTVVGSADHGGFSLSADAAGTGTLIRYGG
jgi:hypothetical protein